MGQAQPWENVCSRPGCNKVHRAKGLCQKHYNEQRNRAKGHKPRKERALCSVPSCDHLSKARGLCVNHYNLMLYHKKKEQQK